MKGREKEAIMKEEKIEIPKELLWDYREPPDDLMWRLQRIVDFFPAYGTDRKTVELLYRYRDQLKMEKGTYRLIQIYKEVWDDKVVVQNMVRNEIGQFD